MATILEQKYKIDDPKFKEFFGGGTIFQPANAGPNTERYFYKDGKVTPFKQVNGSWEGTGYGSKGGPSYKIVQMTPQGLDFFGSQQENAQFLRSETEEYKGAVDRNFGLGDPNAFRPRNSGEDMGSYLAAKQAYEKQTTGSSGVQLGTDKADQGAINNMYQKYFDRDATTAEINNWKQATPGELETFLQKEQTKYGYTSQAQQAEKATPVNIASNNQLSSQQLASPTNVGPDGETPTNQLGTQQLASPTNVGPGGETPTNINVAEQQAGIANTGGGVSNTPTGPDYSQYFNITAPATNTTYGSGSTAYAPNIVDMSQQSAGPSDIYIGTLQTPTFTKPSVEQLAEQYIGSLQYDVDLSRATLENTYNQEYAKFDNQINNLTEQLNQIQSEQAGALGNLQGSLSQYTSSMQSLQAQQQQVTALYNQQSQSYNQISSIEQGADQAIANIKNTTGLKSILAPRASAVAADAASQTGIIRAAISARSQSITGVKNALSAAEDVIKADRQSALDYYYQVKDFYNESRDLVSDFLKTSMEEQQNIVDKQIGLLEGDMDRANEVYRTIEDMMIDPETATMVEQAGITLYDDVYSINQKMSTYNYWTEIQEKENKFEEAGYERVVTDAQLAGKTNDDVMRIVDSRGIERIYLRPQTTQEKDAELARLKAGINVWEDTQKTQNDLSLYSAKENINRSTTAWEEALGRQTSAYEEQLSRETSAYEEQLGRQTYAYESGIDVQEDSAKAQIDTQVAAYKEQLKRETTLTTAQIEQQSKAFEEELKRGTDAYNAQLNVYEAAQKQAIKDGSSVNQNPPTQSNNTQQSPTQSGFQVPAGYEKIDGARYSTGSAQKAAYDDIQVDPTGKFLYGKPKSGATTQAPAQQAPQANITSEEDKFLKDIASYKEMIANYGVTGSALERLKQTIIEKYPNYGLTSAQLEELLKL